MRSAKSDDYAHIQGTLFDFQPEKQKKPTSRLVLKAPLVAGEGWVLEPHVCRHCFGRIASKPLAGGLIEYQCTNCGESSKAIEPSLLCACGIKMHTSVEGKRVGPATKDAGIRCIPNPKKSPSFPAAYVAAYVDPKDRNQT